MYSDYDVKDVEDACSNTKQILSLIHQCLEEENDGKFISLLTNLNNELNKLQYVQRDLHDTYCMEKEDVEHSNVAIKILLKANSDADKSFDVDKHYNALENNYFLTMSDVSNMFRLEDVSKKNKNKIMFNGDISIEMVCRNGHYFVVMHSIKNGSIVNLDPKEINMQNNNNCGIHANELMFVSNTLINFLIEHNTEFKVEDIKSYFVNMFRDYTINNSHLEYKNMKKLLLFIQYLDIMKYFYEDLVNVNNRIPPDLWVQVFKLAVKIKETSDILMDKLIENSPVINYFIEHFDEEKTIEYFSNLVEKRTLNYEKNKIIIDNVLSFLQIDDESLNNKLYAIVASDEIGTKRIINSVVKEITENGYKIDNCIIKDCLNFYVKETNKELNANEEEQNLNNNNDEISINSIADLNNAIELYELYKLLDNVLEIYENFESNKIIEKIADLLLNSSVVNDCTDLLIDVLFNEENNFDIKLNSLIDILDIKIDYLENKNSLNNVLEVENRLEENVDSSIMGMSSV